MTVLMIRSWHGPVLVAAVLVFATADRAEAQFAVGMDVGGSGAPFLFYAPQRVPSPTEFLYDHHRARIAEHANALQQQAAASQAGGSTWRRRGYFDRVREYAGADTYDVNSRQSLNARTAARQPRPAEPPPAERTSTLPLSAFFLSGGELDWPRDAPDTESLRSAKAEAESAVKAVRDEIQSGGRPRAQSVGLAKSKVVDYGRHALADVRANRSETVGHLFHYFLLYLHDALDQAAEPNGP